MRQKAEINVVRRIERCINQKVNTCFSLLTKEVNDCFTKVLSVVIDCAENLEESMREESYNAQVYLEENEGFKQASNDPETDKKDYIRELKYSHPRKRNTNLNDIFTDSKIKNDFDSNTEDLIANQNKESDEDLDRKVIIESIPSSNVDLPGVVKKEMKRIRNSYKIPDDRKEKKFSFPFISKYGQDSENTEFMESPQIKMEHLLPNVDITLDAGEIQNKKIRIFNCEQCRYSCKRKYALYLHVKNVHNKIRDYKCEDCGKAVVTRQCLRKHMRLVHGIGKQEMIEAEVTINETNDSVVL